MSLLFLFISDSSGNMVPYQLVTYKFDGVPEHTVLVRPHGNSKRDRPYRRTMKSTKEQLEAKLKVSKPKDAIEAVFESKGGLLGASSAGQLPRGSTQAYNMKRALLQKEIQASVSPSVPIYSLSGTRDMLYVVMEQCKSVEKENRFVQEVTCAPEPMAVLCSDQQLFDIDFVVIPFSFASLE